MAKTLHASAKLIKVRRLHNALEKTRRKLTREQRNVLLESAVEQLQQARKANQGRLPCSQMLLILDWLEDQGIKTTCDTFYAHLQKKNQVAESSCPGLDQQSSIKTLDVIEITMDQTSISSLSPNGLEETVLKGCPKDTTKLKLYNRKQ